jgi:hypothetical protein
MARKRSTRGKPRSIEIHEAAGAVCTYNRGKWSVHYPDPPKGKTAADGKPKTTAQAKTGTETPPDA